MADQTDARHRWWYWWICALAIIIIVIAGVIGYWAYTANIAALSKPGSLEARMAPRLRDWYIRRAATHGLRAPPPDSPSEISEGQGIFQMGCASCHGKDGRSPTNLGKSMYPNALDLSAPAVQKLSNPELFWVIKNGIRLSGMPGFGNTLSDDEIWQATYYVRSLGSPKK